MIRNEPHLENLDLPGIDINLDQRSLRPVRMRWVELGAAQCVRLPVHLWMAVVTDCFQRIRVRSIEEDFRTRLIIYGVGDILKRARFVGRA